MNLEQNEREFIDACRRSKLKVTYQRLAIFRELAGRTDHPDIENLHAKLLASMPTLSLDTVYRTIRVLEEQGVVRRVSSFVNRGRYDANKDPHAHFVCSRCGAIHDLRRFPIAEMVEPLGREAPGAVNAINIEFRGICERCLESGSNRALPNPPTTTEPKGHEESWNTPSPSSR